MKVTPRHDLDCSTEDGACAIPGADGGATPAISSRREVVYFGDPMCSWCWGISLELRKLHDWCAAGNLPFRLVMGGLRAGGGDPWDARFRNFLRHHWEEVGRATGQPFSTGLLDRDAFEYDTEPACRAVVTARMMSVGDELAFFADVQRGFYVDNEDPKEPGFYPARCRRYGLEPAAFLERFDSDEARAATGADFAASRASGVTGFPTIVLRGDAGQAVVATGFASFDAMRSRIARRLTAKD